MVYVRPREIVVFLVFCTISALGQLAFAQTPPAAPGRQQPQVAPVNYETAHSERRLQAVRTSGKIELNGILDEAAWSEAPMANGFLQREPREGARASFDTEVRVLYDDDALYFGVLALDDEPARIMVNDLKKDYQTNQSDGVTIVLDTFHDERNAYKFATNPGGAKYDEQMSNEGRENNSSWDGIWDVKTRITERGWLAEIRIPFRTLKFRSAELQTWGINFERRIRRFNEDSQWAPIPRIYDLDRVSLAGTLEGLQGLQPGKNIRIKPYGLSSSSTVGTDPTVGDVDGGLDVKYGVTNGLTWDFTLNTDFSQVEADEQQINLTRFNLLFPEKRDFFLENSGIFQFGAPMPTGFGGAGAGRQNQPQEPILFFSRRIGLSDDGEAIPILGGTRLTGRLGAQSLGLLNIQQREKFGEPATNFTALRVRRNVLANSDVGAMVLNKEQDGDRFNRLAGVDAAFRFGDVSFTGYLAKSFSPQSVMPGSGKATIGEVGASYVSRAWQFKGQYSSIGQRFNDELGFVPRTNTRETFLYGRRDFRPRALSSWMRSFFPHYQIYIFQRPDGSLESTYQDWHFPLQWQSGANLEAGINPNMEDIRVPFTINNARKAQVRPGRHEFNEYFIFYNTNNAARFSLQSRFSIGEFYDGYRRAYFFGPSIKPSEKLNANVSLQVNDISLPTAEYVTTLVTGRLNYNFSTKMFLNALLQYNTDSHQWSSNIRFNIIHHALSDFFLVYNERRDERTGDLLNRAVIAKMTYLMAF